MLTLTPQDRNWIRELVLATATALVDADIALAKRVEALEGVAKSFAPGNSYDNTRRALVQGELIPAISDVFETVKGEDAPRPSFWKRVGKFIVGSGSGPYE